MKISGVSKRMEKYFKKTIEDINKQYEIAKESKAIGYDSSYEVDIKLAENLAERVVGLVSVVSPQIENTDIIPRIKELEEEYGKLDWRVAMKIALEIAQEKYCKFENKKEAIEVGIRLGFAYVTVGVVSSPIEGFTDLEIKERLDGKGEYFCLNFAGPIRNAGGTGASVCVLIADYIRSKLGYAKYDATDNEIKRCYSELQDYHERVANLQYFPSRDEIYFLVKNMPLEINGMPSEKIEVKNYKNLPRIKTNFIRSGYCLMYSSCISLKAPKLEKQLAKWGSEMNMDDWNFLKEFLEIQHNSKAKKDVEEIENNSKSESVPEDILEIIKLKQNLEKNYTFVDDLIAGRPVFSYPLASGGFRVRYGKSRVSGYSACSMNPATYTVMDDFLATGTQLKIELPGKSTTVTSCDTIMAPVVKLKDGSVVELDSVEQANSIKSNIEEILFAGDVLINYGDFFDRAHRLVPAGYCEEWWVQELQQEINKYIADDISFENKIIQIAEALKIDNVVLNDFINDPLKKIPSSLIAIKLSEFFTKLPLHPKYTYFWNEAKLEYFKDFLKVLSMFKIETSDEQIKKMVIPYSENNEEVQFRNAKRFLELSGVPHFLVGKEFIFIDGSIARSLIGTFSLDDKVKFEELYNYVNSLVKTSEKLLKEGKIDKSLGGVAILYAINKYSKIKIENKSGTFIGARMGRPEKAKMRQMQGSPHGLFPLGRDGGRYKTFNEAYKKKSIKAEFELWQDEESSEESILPINYKTNNNCVKKVWDNKEKKVKNLSEKKENQWLREFKTIEYDFKSHIDWCLNKIDEEEIPVLVKGVQGTSSKIHSPENPLKAILRAKHNVFVNRDGTTRYDASELPITHFKPLEVGTSISKLRILGYTHDIYGIPLERENQILELFAQDCILPACIDSPNEPADSVFKRMADFIDDELEYLYDQERYYNLKTKKDLVGHQVIMLAPHTSAGIVGRIIGFSKTQGLFCHPLMHAAVRRDCDGDEAAVFLLLDGLLNFSKKYLSNKLGGTMDAPLVLTSILNPAEVDDMVFNIEREKMYPIEFYQACRKQKMPHEFRMRLTKESLGSEAQYEGFTFTHDTSDINLGNKCSLYKILPTMKEKLDAQMFLAEKIRAVDESEVAKSIINKHFFKDAKGNLRKFSQQQFRCSKCNTKFRRPPLSGKCNECNSNSIIFTVSEGSIKKYLGYSKDLVEKYNLPKYTKESLELLLDAIDSIFGVNDFNQENVLKFTDNNEELR